MRSPENNPLVTILIPVYNGANFLREAIESALAQDYPNIEIIVVNDGSNDGGATDAIAKSYGSRIRYSTKPNGGVASALNLGICEMRGEYLSWLSHDGLYEPNKISAQITALNSRGLSERAIAYCGWKSIDSTGALLRTDLISDCHPRERLENPLYPLLNGLIHGCALLNSRDCLRGADRFDEGLRSTQDYDFWRRIFRGKQIVFVDQPLIRSRLHEDQGSRTIRAELEMEVLWSKIFGSVTKDEMIALYGSPAEFFKCGLKFSRKNLRLPAIDRLLKTREIEMLLNEDDVPWGRRIVSRIDLLKTRIVPTSADLKAAVRKFAHQHDLKVVFALNRSRQKLARRFGVGI